MDEVCRLCSLKSEKLVSVFSFQKDRLLSDMIHIICPIKIDISDDLPKSICKSCLKLILDAISLREKSVKSDLKFRSKSSAEPLEISQEVDPFYSTGFFDSDSNDESTKNTKRIKTARSSSSEAESDFNPDSRMRGIKYKTDNEKRFKCPDCDSTFSFQTNVRRHIRLVHNATTPKRKLENSTDSSCCAICGMSFTLASNMRRHIRTLHAGEMKDVVKNEEPTGLVEFIKAEPLWMRKKKGSSF